MVNKSSNLNYFFLHQLAFKVDGINGVYSDNLEDISPVEGNSLRQFNEKEIDIDYNARPVSSSEVLEEPNVNINYSVSYEGEHVEFSIEKKGEILGINVETNEGYRNNILRDFKWAIDRLERDTSSTVFETELLEYSEEQGIAKLMCRY